MHKCEDCTIMKFDINLFSEIKYFSMYNILRHALSHSVSIYWKFTFFNKPFQCELKL